MKAFRLIAMISLCVALILSQLTIHSQRATIKNAMALAEAQSSLLKKRGSQVDEAQAGWKNCLGMVDGMLTTNKQMQKTVGIYRGMLGLD